VYNSLPVLAPERGRLSSRAAPHCSLRIVLTLIELHADSHQNSCEAADFVIETSDCLCFKISGTANHYGRRLAVPPWKGQRRPKPPCGGRLATGDCPDIPSHAPRMSCYTGATSTTNATTTLRAGQRAGGGGRMPCCHRECAGAPEDNSTARARCRCCCDAEPHGSPASTRPNDAGVSPGLLRLESHHVSASYLSDSQSTRQLATTA
jgi:hypothetical protein